MRRPPIRPKVAVQRAHAAQEEGQAATVARAERNRRPKVTLVADDEQRTITVEVKARSREVDSSSLTAACPEIMTEVTLVSLPIDCTVNIEL